MSTSRNFLLTLNEETLPHYKEIVEYVTSLSQFQYMLVCEHIGQENKHYHMFLQYNTSKRLSIQKIFGAHIDKCYGSAQQNIDYCKCNDEKHKKEGITHVLIEEQGTPKLKGGNWTIKRLRECDDESEIPSHLLNIKRRLIEEEETEIDIEDWAKEVKVYYIQGPSGIGKTEKAKQIVRDNKEKYGTKISAIKYENGFYSGIKRNTKIAIYDDFRDSHMKPSEFIHLIDYNKHFLNIKGGHILNKFELIIFTSVIPLSCIYSKMLDTEPKKQWERRIEIIDMFPPEKVSIGGYDIGWRTEFNELENYKPSTSELVEHEVTDDWDNN